MPDPRNKRGISTCAACYSRKQKCNRRFPCNHCTRRRQPEACIYTATPAARASKGSFSAAEDGSGRSSANSCATSPFYDAKPFALATAPMHGIGGREASLAKSFGYSEDSNSNTMALLKACGVSEMPVNALPCMVDSVHRDLERIPSRQILDSLLRHFVSELAWMQQLLHTPGFLARYQQWWLLERPLSPSDIEFAILFLRICAYTTCFVTAPFYTIDGKTIVQLSEVEAACGEIADSLEKACIALDWTGSLIRVQHLIFTAMKFCCEGRTDKYWEGIARASQAAQKAGIHREPLGSRNCNWNLEDEMQRKVLCNLYILDSHLARQLDRVPFLPNCIVDNRLPRMHIPADASQLDSDLGAPDLFTERLLQVQLAKFWRTADQTEDSEYDPVHAEQRYEKFSTEYLERLPSAFALKPDTKWDEHLPRLATQRRVLHLYIFDSICCNFRRSVLLQPEEIARLPPYKQVLLRSHRKVLANAAMRELDQIATLAVVPDFGAIVFNSFEATVLLLSLCANVESLVEGQHETSYVSGFEFVRLTRKRMLQAAERGMQRLQELADTSDMAAIGARTVAQLFGHISSQDEDSALMPTTSWSTTSLASAVDQVVLQGGNHLSSGEQAYGSAGDPILGGSSVVEDWFDMDFMLPNGWVDEWFPPPNES